MMGTSVIYSTGDYGVAGFEGVCLNSNCMTWVLLRVSCFFVLTILYAVQEDPTHGTVFNPEFPVGADLPFFVSNDTRLHFRLRARS